MKKIILAILANGLGLYIATKFVSGVTVPLDIKNFALVIVALTLINLLLKPIMKLALLPVIILTFGLASFLVNALMLYFLDFLLPAVTIEGFLALIIATFILTLTNTIARSLGKK